MKTTFNQFIREDQEHMKPIAQTFNSLYKSIKDGKFRLDGSKLMMTHVDISGLALISLEGCPTAGVIDFSCMGNRLRSLRGSPAIVAGYFDCSHNVIKSLDGAPVVTGTFKAKDNSISSFEGTLKTVAGNMDLENNKFSTLKDIHKHIHAINGSLNLLRNPIKSNILGLLKIEGLRTISLDDDRISDIINKYLPMGDLFACQQELIDAGFEEYAQL